jgi:hypothetical protein
VVQVHLGPQINPADFPAGFFYDEFVTDVFIK